MFLNCSVPKTNMGIHCHVSNAVFQSIAALLHNLLRRHLTGANNSRAMLTIQHHGYYQVTLKWENRSLKA